MFLPPFPIFSRESTLFLILFLYTLPSPLRLLFSMPPCYLFPINILPLLFIPLFFFLNPSLLSPIPLPLILIFSHSSPASCHLYYLPLLLILLFLTYWPASPRPHHPLILPLPYLPCSLSSSILSLSVSFYVALVIPYPTPYPLLFSCPRTHPYLSLPSPLSSPFNLNHHIFPLSLSF